MAPLLRLGLKPQEVVCFDFWQCVGRVLGTSCVHRRVQQHHSAIAEQTGRLVLDVFVEQQPYREAGDLPFVVLYKLQTAEHIRLYGGRLDDKRSIVVTTRTPLTDGVPTAQAVCYRARFSNQGGFVRLTNEKATLEISKKCSVRVEFNDTRITRIELVEE